jgi:DNA-3-methyladenine glycosylase
MKKLARSFFCRDTIKVAQDLLGQVLVFGSYQGIITETEAYRGEDDEASHAFRGMTPRSSIMFSQPGVSYVYFIYGKYYCLNIVTEAEGDPGAVLIRGIKLINPPYTNIAGPGKICRTFGITTAHNGLDLTTQHDFYVTSGQANNIFQATPRIGIRKAMDKNWRFIINIP